MRLGVGDLVQPPRDAEDGSPSMLTVAGTMGATAAPTDLGSRIRVYRLKQF
jgi:hypothetical protein